MSKRGEQCGYCGSGAQKVCWRCFNSTIERLEREIEKRNCIIHVNQHSCAADGNLSI